MFFGSFFGGTNAAQYQLQKVPSLNILGSCQLVRTTAQQYRWTAAQQYRQHIAHKYRGNVIKKYRWNVIQKYRLRHVFSVTWTS